MKVESPQSLTEARASKRDSPGPDGAAWAKAKRVAKAMGIESFMVKKSSVKQGPRNRQGRSDVLVSKERFSDFEGYFHQLWEDLGRLLYPRLLLLVERKRETNAAKKVAYIH